MSKHCPFCGHAEAKLHIGEGKGEGGVNRYRFVCSTCGTFTDFFDEFIHGTREQVIQKAEAAWNRRDRTARSEELATLVGRLRSLLITIDAGCRAKSKAAAEARECIIAMYEEFDLILLTARKGGKIQKRQVNRELR